ncbi:MAG: hypothetical protein VX899_01145 [Myxococcota bacterium]|nr:hypothetical protein [Myxococcota bacterium]
MASLRKDAMAKVIDAAAGKTCRCGHSVDHVMVSPEPTYNGWGTFWSLFMGVSTAPIKLTFSCRVCKGVLLVTRDPTVLESFI